MERVATVASSLQVVTSLSLTERTVIRMKLMIDISDSTYETIMARDWKNAGWLFGEELKAIHDGTPIPKNATNGDVLKRLLYGKAIITEFIHDVNISVNNNVIGQFDRKWWRSLYKRGDTE